MKKAIAKAIYYISPAYIVPAFISLLVYVCFVNDSSFKDAISDVLFCSVLSVFITGLVFMSVDLMEWTKRNKDSKGE